MHSQLNLFDPIALDLFCGAGGSAVGLSRGGFRLVGVDHKPMPDYPYSFVQADAMEILQRWASEGEHVLSEYDLPVPDFVWASPPCQSFSAYRRKDPNRIGFKAKDLIAEVRSLVQRIGKPYIIENVEAAPLKETAIKLCGSMFGLDVRRHRLFECSFPVRQPPCNHKLHVSRGRRFPPATNRPNKRYTCEIGVWRIPLDVQKKAMGITHIDDLKTLSQAIPPAYSQYLAEEYMRWVTQRNSKGVSTSIVRSAKNSHAS